MRYCLIILLSFMASCVMAQEQEDSVTVTTAATAPTEEAILFMPLKYDRELVKERFTLGTDTTALVRRALMNVYLKHPEKVGRNSVPNNETEQENIDQLKAGHLKMVTDTKDGKDNDEEENVFVAEEETVDLVVTKPDFWTFSSDYSLQFMQNYISPNWYKSGNSNYSLLAATALQYNYNNKQRVKWDNKLEMRLGLQATAADTINKFKTSEDLIRYTTQLSFQAYRKWYYAMQMIATTQFGHGKKDNDQAIYSDFMSPFTLNLSIGMNYTLETENGKLTGNILLAPVSYKMIYTDRLSLASRFGITEGKHTDNRYGSMFNAEVTWKPLDNFRWQSRLYAYTTFHTVQVEWENTLTFQFNRYVSAKIFIYPRFDDAEEKSTNTYWQLNEHLSLGFAYNI